MLRLKFYGILNFLKNIRGSSGFRKIWAIVLKLHKYIEHNILYIEPMVLSLAKIDFEAFKFFEILITLKISSKLSNSGKFRSKYRAEILCVNELILSDVWY